MNENRFGVAFVGAGAVVERRHLPGLLLHDQGEARAIFDSDQQKASAVAAQFNIPRVAASLTEAVEADDIDAVVVASPNAFHRAAVECAAEAGKHIFCEKPIALTLRDARAMCEAADQAGVVLFLGFHHRFSSEHQCVRRILDEGLIGEVRASQSLISEPIDVIPGRETNYRFDVAQGGGLTLMDVGSHRLDQLRHLLGEVNEVYAEMASVLPTHDLDDSVVLTLRMQCSALASLAFHRFSRSFLSPCTLLGTSGSVSMGAFVVNPYQSAPVSLFLERSPEELPADLRPWYRPEAWWSEGQPGWINLWPPRRNTFEAEYEAFFAAIRGQTPVAVGGTDGYRALEIVLAAYLSLAEHRPVRLPLDPELDIPPPRF